MEDSPKPEKFDMDPKDYEEWVELFGSFMSGMDQNWDKILKKVQAKKSERPWTKVKIAEMCDELKLESKAVDAMNRILYTNLLA